MSPTNINSPYYAQCYPGVATPAPSPSSSSSQVQTTPKPGVTLPYTTSKVPTTTFSTGTTPPTQSSPGGSNPTPTSLQQGWYWIRAVASPNFHSYLAAAPTASPTMSPSAILASPSLGISGQFNIISGQLVLNKFGNGDNWYMHVENPADKTQRKLRTWFEQGKPATYGAFAFQGDTLTWSVEDIKRPNTAAWLVCGEGKELFVNTGAYLYQTPEGCFDHTVSSCLYVPD